MVFTGSWICEGVNSTGFSWLCGCIFFGIFLVIPILGVAWVLSVDEKGDLDLALWCVLDVVKIFGIVTILVFVKVLV